MTSISQKVAYVKSQGQTRTHHCHWPDCDKQVPPAMWGCRPHWFKLPLEIRTAIWNAYRPGQEVSMSPGRAYVEAANRAQEWIRDHLAGALDSPRKNDDRTRDLFGD